MIRQNGSFRDRLWGLGALRSAVLLLVIAATMVFGALDIVQSLEFGALWPLALLALAFGWLLAAMRSPGWLAAVFGVTSGFGLVFMRIGRLGEQVILLFGAWVNYARLVLETRRMPLLALLEPAVQELLAGVGVLLGRLDLWLQTFLSGETTYDPLALALVWALAIWGVAMWAVWAVRRWGRPIVAGLPAIFVLGTSLAFVGGSSNWILPILAAILALTILTEQDLRELRWQHIGARVPDLVRRNVTLSALLITAGLVTAAYITPSISIEDIRDYLDRQTETGDSDKRVAVGVPSEDGEGSGVSASGETRLNSFRNGGLPTQHLIGSGPELSEQVVMVVRAQELQPELLALQTGGETPDYYWRNLTYDTYSGRGWFTGPIEAQTFAAGDLAITTSSRNQRLFRQQVSMVEDREGLLYYSGSLVTADHDFRVAYRLYSNPDALADPFGAEIGANVYQAESLLPIYSEDDLRQTGQNYPTEIARRYLGLPVSMSDRVMQLALDLTATEPTAYDRALAIESYLRTFPYTLDLPPPPAGENIEIADYFLFTLQRGYCDYYATTMAVLARAAGLPARVVFGYIGGTYDAENDVYVVTEDKAHSWVEIYFPGYGWIEFEPTAGRPAIERRSESLPEVPDELLAPLAGFIEASDVDPVPVSPLSQINWGLIIAAAFGLMGLVVLFVLYVWPVMDAWRLRLMAPQSVVSELFLRLYLSAPSLNMPPQGEKTPYEFSTEFARQFSRLLVNRRSLSLIETTRGEVAWLTDSFVGYRYGAHLPDQSVKTKAIHAWHRWRGLLREARWQAFRNRVRSRRRR